MEKVSFQTLITNRVFLKNLIEGLRAILQSSEGDKDGSIEKRFLQFKRHLRNLIFSASVNDLNINRNLLNTKQFTDYSITPGYPGSFLSFVINVVREHNFILRNSLEQLSNQREFEKRNQKLKEILMKISSITTDDLNLEKKKKIVKEKDIWNGALNVEYSNQTIDAIFKNPGLKEIFSDVLNGIIKEVDKKLTTQNVQSKKKLSPEDIDDETHFSNLTEIVNILKTTEQKFINSKVSSIGSNIISKISPKENVQLGRDAWKLLTADFTDQDYKISSDLSFKKKTSRCNDLIQLNTQGKLNTIGNISGITISNGNMSNVLDGVLCIKNYNIVIKNPDNSTVSLKLNLKIPDILKKDVVQMNLCHAVILLNKKEKKFKFYVKGKKCCVDNIFKIIGYNTCLNKCLK